MGKTNYGAAFGQGGRCVRSFEAITRNSLSYVFSQFGRACRNKSESGSCYVLSASEPFNEEMAIDFERLVNWLRHYGLPQYHVHVSGHIMPFQLKNIPKEINATKIFPIHTKHVDLFAEFTKDVKSETVLIERDKEYMVGV